MTTFEDIPLIMGVEEFAEIARLNPDTVRRQLRRGAIPGIKLAGEWKICRDAALPGMAEAVETARGARRAGDLRG